MNILGFFHEGMLFYLHVFIFVLQISPEHERHIREHEYLADILSDWEE